MSSNTFVYACVLDDDKIEVGSYRGSPGQSFTRATKLVRINPNERHTFEETFILLLQRRGFWSHDNIFYPNAWFEFDKIARFFLRPNESIIHLQAMPHNSQIGGLQIMTFEPPFIHEDTQAPSTNRRSWRRSARRVWIS